MFDDIKLEAIDFETMTSNGVCIVRSTYIHPDLGSVVATGVSRRHPSDKNDPTVGYLLAFSRSVESLSRKIQKRANGLVAMNDARARQLAARRDETATVKATVKKPNRAQLVPAHVLERSRHNKARVTN